MSRSLQVGQQRLINLAIVTSSLLPAESCQALEEKIYPCCSHSASIDTGPTPCVELRADIPTGSRRNLYSGLSSCCRPHQQCWLLSSTYNSRHHYANPLTCYHTFSRSHVPPCNTVPTSPPCMRAGNTCSRRCQKSNKSHDLGSFTVLSLAPQGPPLSLSLSLSHPFHAPTHQLFTSKWGA